MDKILLVEDIAAQLAILQRNVAGQDRWIDFARSTEEAMDKLAERDYDLVILDLGFRMQTRMNGDAGFEVLRYAKERDPDIQVIVATNGATPERCEEAMRLGAFDMIDRSSLGLHYPAMLKAKASYALHYRRLLRQFGDSNRQTP